MEQMEVPYKVYKTWYVGDALLKLEGYDDLRRITLYLSEYVKIEGKYKSYPDILEVEGIIAFVDEKGNVDNDLVYYQASSINKEFREVK